MFYNETYERLKDSTETNMIDEGERITASFANAHRVYYYMSDDNKAAPHINTLTSVEVINFCDLLYIIYEINIEDVRKLQHYYQLYISNFTNDIPRILRKNRNQIKTFSEMMGSCHAKFLEKEKLNSYLKFMINNKKEK